MTVYCLRQSNSKLTAFGDDLTAGVENIKLDLGITLTVTCKENYFLAVCIYAERFQGYGIAEIKRRETVCCAVSVERIEKIL